MVICTNTTKKTLTLVISLTIMVITFMALFFVSIAPLTPIEQDQQIRNKMQTITIVIITIIATIGFITVSDIQQIINASNINRPAQPDPSYNGESASIALSRDPHTTSPSVPSVTIPQNNKPQEPEESKEKYQKYHSSNAIDDLDLT